MSGPALLPQISLIVPACGSASAGDEVRVIERRLRGLLELDYPDLEILFVDDGRDEARYAAAESLAATADGRLRTFRRAEATCGEAANLGLRISRRPLVLCIDAGATLTGMDVAAVRHFRDENVAAVVGTGTKRGAGTAAGHDLPAPRDPAGAPSRPPSWRSSGAVSATFRGVPLLPGRPVLFRRAALVGIGGYASAEDGSVAITEPAVRLFADGHDLRAEPTLISLVETPSMSPGDLRRRCRRLRESMRVLRRSVRPLLTGLRRRRTDGVRPPAVREGAAGGEFLEHHERAKRRLVPRDGGVRQP